MVHIYKPLGDKKRRELLTALRGNAHEDRAIHMDPHDTSFVPNEDAEVPEDGVISAIKSVPCHY